MADVAVPAVHTISAAEIALRQQEARYGFQKFIWGTVVIGLASVAIPATVTIVSALIEDWRKKTEFEQTVVRGQQDYIKSFLDTAVNQNIELRIRFADYFAHVAGAKERSDWQSYFEDLRTNRERIHKKINELEAEKVKIQKGTDPQLEFETYRELKWAYDEIGSSPIETGAYQPKVAVYAETVSVVRRLASLKTPIDPNSTDYKRFWDLYWKDLAGIESEQVEAKMVQIGNVLRDYEKNKQAPDDRLTVLAYELAIIVANEQTTPSKLTNRVNESLQSLGYTQPLQ
ncbi:hypothetical protein [Rhizobium sp. WSM1325]|uniref:hypothetical protein n=1 Tax=Rhizobium sp. WSM1325 TaxID=3444086 RepID=UPI000FF583CE|nr:hypothetical protein [Rhizobium leguminosarum]RWY75289.1 hypothetical protein EHI48_19115 [Rhizobium leguminosarum]